MWLLPASEAGGILSSWRFRRWWQCLVVGRFSVIFISSSGNHHLPLIRVVKESWQSTDELNVWTHQNVCALSRLNQYSHNYRLAGTCWCIWITPLPSLMYRLFRNISEDNTPLTQSPVIAQLMFYKCRCNNSETKLIKDSLITAEDSNMRGSNISILWICMNTV